MCECDGPAVKTFNVLLLMLLDASFGIGFCRSNSHQPPSINKNKKIYIYISIWVIHTNVEVTTSQHLAMVDY
jgi:hypothetical protein